jgi:uncharacterized protein DUF2190
MAGENLVFTRSMEAGADLSAKQFYFVKESSGKAILCSTLGEKSEGVLNNAPESGAMARIGQLGTAKVVASGAIAVGAWITTDAAAKAVATTTAGHVVRGRAIEAATADGDIIEIELCLFVL